MKDAGPKKLKFDSIVKVIASFMNYKNTRQCLLIYQCYVMKPGNYDVLTMSIVYTSPDISTHRY